MEDRVEKLEKRVENIEETLGWVCNSLNRILDTFEKQGVELRIPPPPLPTPILPTPEPTRQTRISISGLPPNMSEDGVQKLNKFGPIKEIVLNTGLCFVEFENTQDDGEAVIFLNGKVLAGSKISVEFIVEGGEGCVKTFGGGED